RRILPSPVATAEIVVMLASVRPRRDRRLRVGAHPLRGEDHRLALPDVVERRDAGGGHVGVLHHGLVELPPLGDEPSPVALPEVVTVEAGQGLDGGGRRHAAAGRGLAGGARRHDEGTSRQERPPPVAARTRSTHPADDETPSPPPPRRRTPNSAAAAPADRHAARAAGTASLRYSVRVRPGLPRGLPRRTSAELAPHR